MLTMRSLGLLHSTLLIAASVAACGGDDVAASGDGTGASSSSGGSDGTSSGSGDTGTTAIADTTATTEPDTSGTTGTPVDSSGTAVVDESSSSSGTPNEDPIAIDDLYAMVMNDAPLQLTADVGVLVNDSDPDGDPLTVADFDAVSEAGGAVVVDDDGALTYTPPADFWGPDGFTYTIDDGNGGSATAHVRVTVTPTTISLGEVTGGVGGFTIDGTGAGLQTGWSVAGGGDVDGDGHADVLVGAPSSDIDGNGEGRAFVVFGKSTGETVALGDVLLGEGGFAIDGDADTDQASRAADIGWPYMSSATPPSRVCRIRHAWPCASSASSGSLKRRPSSRLGASTAWAGSESRNGRARLPATTVPLASGNATMQGTERTPSIRDSTLTTPLRTAAIDAWRLPRSMPTVACPGRNDGVPCDGVPPRRATLSAADILPWSIVTESPGVGAPACASERSCV